LEIKKAQALQQKEQEKKRLLELEI